MGGVLDKERVVRQENLSSYLTAENARNTYIIKPIDDSYVLQKFADKTYLKIPSNDEYLLKSSANNLYQPRSNYVSLEDFNTYKTSVDGLYQPKGSYQISGDYLTKSITDGLYQPKGSYVTLQSNGNLNVNSNIYSTNSVISEGPIWNKSSDFTLGINDSRGTFNNGVTSGRALVKDTNSTLTINFAGDFGGGVRIDGNKGLTLSNGGINANTAGTQSNIANLNVSNGFNAQNANSRFYAVTLGAGGINSTGNIIAGQTKLGTWSDVSGNYSYFGNKNVTNTNQYGIIQLNNGDTYISGNTFVKIGPNNNQALTVDNSGNLCIGTTCINSAQLATMKSKLGV